MNNRQDLKNQISARLEVAKEAGADKATVTFFQGLNFNIPDNLRDRLLPYLPEVERAITDAESKNRARDLTYNFLTKILPLLFESDGDSVTAGRLRAYPAGISFMDLRNSIVLFCMERNLLNPDRTVKFDRPRKSEIEFAVYDIMVGCELSAPHLDRRGSESAGRCFVTALGSAEDAVQAQERIYSGRWILGSGYEKLAINPNAKIYTIFFEILDRLFGVSPIQLGGAA